MIRSWFTPPLTSAHGGKVDRLFRTRSSSAHDFGGRLRPGLGSPLHQARSEEQVNSALNRSFPACLVLDARAEPARVLELCS